MSFVQTLKYAFVCKVQLLKEALAKYGKSRSTILSLLRSSSLARMYQRKQSLGIEALDFLLSNQIISLDDRTNLVNYFIGVETK